MNRVLERTLAWRPSSESHLHEGQSSITDVLCGVDQEKLWTTLEDGNVLVLASKNNYCQE